jgi:predicted PurR-regulated permease PerM
MNTNTNASQAAAQPQRPYKREVKNILIHRPMQREFSFMLIALFMVASAAIAWIIHQTIRDAAFGGGLYYGKINPFQVLSEVSYQVIIRVTLVLIVTLLIIGGYGVVFLHRVAGPVYRFRKTLLSLNRGEKPADIKLRESDFFHEMAHDINVVLKRSRSEQEKLTDLKNKLNELIRSAPSEDVRQKAQHLKELAESFTQS